MLPECARMECDSTRRTGTAACVDQAPCRVFLCARCRCQVLVCRRCDRGQLYCAGTCAQKARRDRQREARRRYQATLRGRAMHADRSRRYRARQQRVTHHGLTKPDNEGLSPRSKVDAVSSAPSFNRMRPKPPICHFADARPRHFCVCRRFACTSTWPKEPDLRQRAPT